jgi:hypothetical protein
MWFIIAVVITITFAFPLLLLYEGLSLLLTHSAVAGVRNGADVLLKTIFIAFGGRRGLVVFGVLLSGAGAWLIGRDLKRRGPIQPRFLGLMLLESVVYAALLGFVVAGLTALLLRMSAVAATGGVGALPIGTQLVVSLGAGIYEELLFRVIMVSGFTVIGVAIGWRRPVAVGVAVVASAIIFSSFHYVGPYGDALTLQSFTFRAIAGLMFSGLYVWRGFGITAWTHALYDVALALLLTSS